MVCCTSSIYIFIMHQLFVVLFRKMVYLSILHSYFLPRFPEFELELISLVSESVSVFWGDDDPASLKINLNVSSDFLENYKNNNKFTNEYL